MTGARTTRRLVTGAAALLAALALVAGGVAAASTTSTASPSGSAGTSADGSVADVGVYSCGPGWRTPPRAGQRTITVHNTGDAVVSVALRQAGSPLVYAQLLLLGPGVTRTMTAVIPRGHYDLACTYTEGETVFSRAVTVTGPVVTGAHPYVPVTLAEAQAAVSRDRATVSAGLTTLATDTDALLAAARSGSTAVTESAWLIAHLDYERLGVAYDTFGDFDQEINGTPQGLPGGVDDPSWTGFLRLEYALWHGQPAATVVSVATTLDTDVHQLVVAFPDQTTPADDLSLRTHEILENTLQFELTGEDDEGSHTELATAAANVAGTQTTLASIASLLQSRDDALLVRATTGLDQLAALLASYRQPDGTWVALGALTTSQRQQLDSQVSGLLETLDPIPDLLELPPAVDAS